MLDDIIRLGDVVRHKERPDRMTVVTVQDTQAWCELMDGEAAGLLVLIKLSNLMKIEHRR
jgi:hypothetical protein